MNCLNIMKLLVTKPYGEYRGNCNLLAKDISHSCWLVQFPSLWHVFLATCSKPFKFQILSHQFLRHPVSVFDCDLLIDPSEATDKIGELQVP